MVYLSIDKVGQWSHYLATWLFLNNIFWLLPNLFRSTFPRVAFQVRSFIPEIISSKSHVATFMMSSLMTSFIDGYATVSNWSSVSKFVNLYLWKIKSYSRADAPDFRYRGLNVSTEPLIKVSRQKWTGLEHSPNPSIKINIFLLIKAFLYFTKKVISHISLYFRIGIGLVYLLKTLPKIKKSPHA